LLVSFFDLHYIFVLSTLGCQMSQITILVGTMTGTAEMVADEMADTLGAEGFDAPVKPMDGLDGAALTGGGVFLICTSTYGQGDVPDNALGLYEHLQETRPDLSAVRYGVFAMGDSTYFATFCAGGKLFDALLAELGAARIGDVLEHDASSGTMPEDAAVEWVADWARSV
jgi:MioC protein